MLCQATKILCFFIYSYFSSNEHLRISILYNPIDNDIDIKQKNILIFQVYSFSPRFPSLYSSLNLIFLKLCIKAIYCISHYKTCTNKAPAAGVAPTPVTSVAAEPLAPIASDVLSNSSAFSIKSGRPSNSILF